MQLELDHLRQITTLTVPLNASGIPFACLPTWPPLRSPIATLRYAGRGPGRRQPEVNLQGLNSNLHKCHAT